MANVKVWNLNVHPFKQVFKGDLIEIPAQGHIEMEFYEAHEFKGTYSPRLLDGDGNPDPRGYKMIRITEGNEPPPESSLGFDCMSCKQKFATDVALLAHIESEHAHQKNHDEQAEAEIKKKAPKKVA